MTGAPHPSLVWPARLSRSLDRAWAAGLCRRPPLDPDAIVAHAVGREGQQPVVGPWRERLDWLCTALVGEARLSSLGRTIAYGQLVRIVAARIRAERLWLEHPQILDRPITAPVALVGQMRSGTTRVHRLLACDPAFAHTRLFESLEPVPHRGWRRTIDPRPLAALAGIAFLNHCNPELAHIHPTSPFAPEEEFGLHAFSLWGAQFEGQWHVPGYARRCEQAGADDIYDEFAKLLRTIGWARGDDAARRWLIKAPQFCQDLGPLVTRFHDVRIIHLTRRSDEIVASGASLAWHQTRIQSDHADPAAIGAEWLRKTALRETRVRLALDAHSHIARFDLNYDDLSSDWHGAMRRLYRFVGQPLSDAIEARMAAHVERPAAHLGHHYSLEDFGLDRATVASALS